MFSVVAIAILLCSIKHDLCDYNYDYTSARSSSSLANSLTGCYSCLKINHTPVKHWNINKNVDSSLMFVIFLKTEWIFLHNIKLQVNILCATKIESIHQWIDLVFMHVMKTKTIFTRYKKKLSRFLLKSFKNRISFYGCYKNQVDFCSIQKLSWFLQESYKTKSIFNKQATKTESIFSNMNQTGFREKSTHQKA